MKNGYKKLITERIKDEVNRWIDELKLKSKELLLTKQWHIIFPKGFSSGQNVLPVITSSKQGKHLIAEVQFVLPDDLELDINDVELVLKNEPYVETKGIRKNLPVPLDEPLDVLNDLIIGINDFLQNLNVSIPQSNVGPLLSMPAQQTSSSRLKVNPNHATILPIQNKTENAIDKIKQQMIKSPHFP